MNINSKSTTMFYNEMPECVSHKNDFTVVSKCPQKVPKCMRKKMYV